MKKDIHPESHEVEAVCSCGNRLTVISTYSSDKMSLEVCAACHPFYTGKQKILESARQVDKFRRRYGKRRA